MKTLALLVLAATGCFAQCYSGNVAQCGPTTYVTQSGVIPGSVPSVSVSYNVVYSTGAGIRVQDIFYLTAQGLTGKHPGCAGPLFEPHPGGGNAGDKQQFAFVGYSDYVLMAELTGCPVYAPNYTLNVTGGAHWITQWQDLMCGRRSIANHITAGTWPGSLAAGFQDVGFSWGTYAALMTDPGILSQLVAAGYAESCEYSDAYTVQSFQGHGVVWAFKDNCDNQSGGGCNFSNVTTLFPVATGNNFNCQTNTMDACAAGATGTNGFGWIAGAPLTYPLTQTRKYFANGSADTLLIPTYEITKAIAAFNAAGLIPDAFIDPEGSGSHQAGLYLQTAAQTWMRLITRIQNVSHVTGGGFGAMGGGFGF